MSTVSVSPETFTFTLYTAEPIRVTAERVTADVAVPGDPTVRVEVDESSPLGRTWVRDEGDTVVIAIEGGAIEDPTVPRQLSERLTAETVGRLLFRVRDRRTPGFGQPPPDEELTLVQQTAWDAYALGRLGRLGYDVRRPRRLYHFRNRHGFTDVADRAFDRLWTAEGLTWADIQAVCDETAAAQAG